VDGGARDGEAAISRIDDFRRAVSDAARLRADVGALPGYAVRKLEPDVREDERAVSLSSASELLRLVNEVLRSPEGRALMFAIVDRRVESAREEAVRECREFLDEHLAREIVES
jgi:hypothetical protein